MNKPLSRRTVLKGVGATLALPLLDAMAPQAKAAAPAAASPKRLAFFYIPNGVIRDGWFPEKTDAHYELPSTLRPLADFKQDTLIVSGLDRTFASGSDVHAQCGCCWLTSSPPTERLDGNLPINTTLDQVIASQVGGRSVFPSLELSCNSFTNTRESKSFDAISWYAPGHAAESERNPQKLFRRMLGKDAKIDRSALDILREDARDLHRTLGRADQRKLDEYLESVRAIEQQLKRIAASRDQGQRSKDRHARRNTCRPRRIYPTNGRSRRARVSSGSHANRHEYDRTGTLANATVVSWRIRQAESTSCDDARERQRQTSKG